jgi:hypothetical protein
LVKTLLTNLKQATSNATTHLVIVEESIGIIKKEAVDAIAEITLFFCNNNQPWRFLLAKSL